MFGLLTNVHASGHTCLEVRLLWKIPTWTQGLSGGTLSPRHRASTSEEQVSWDSYHRPIPLATTLNMLCSELYQWYHLIAPHTSNISAMSSRVHPWLSKQAWIYLAYGTWVLCWRCGISNPAPNQKLQPHSKVWDPVFAHGPNLVTTCFHMKKNEPLLNGWGEKNQKINSMLWLVRIIWNSNFGVYK